MATVVGRGGDSAVLLEGLLLKQAQHTALLHQRWVRLLADGRLQYWAAALAHGPPRAQGHALEAEEWWPDRERRKLASMVAHDALAIKQGVNAMRKRVQSQPSFSQTELAHADDDQFFGRCFRVRVAMQAMPESSEVGSGSDEWIQLVAPSRAERLRWLSALAAHINRAPAAAPSAAAPAAAPAASSMQAVLDELPEVWALWSDVGNTAAAAARYSELLRLAPACIELLHDRGNFHMRVGELRRAEVDFSAALELTSERAELYNDRAVCRIEQGLFVEALSDVKRAVRLRPDFAEAISNAGNAHRRLGHYEFAKQAYDTALLLAPLDARTWNNRGALQEDLGHLVAAELDVKRALELGGCPKAQENMERIAARLASGDIELRPLRPCWRALESDSHGVLVTFTFGEGPLGMFIVNAGAPMRPRASQPPFPEAAEAAASGEGEERLERWPAARDGEAVIANVFEGSQAYDCGVPVGGVIVGINGTTIGAISHAEITGRMQAASRPLSLRVRCPPRNATPGAHGAGDAEAEPPAEPSSDAMPCVAGPSAEPAGGGAGIERGRDIPQRPPIDIDPLPPGGGD